MHNEGRLYYSDARVDRKKPPRVWFAVAVILFVVLLSLITLLLSEKQNLESRVTELSSQANALRVDVAVLRDEVTLLVQEKVELEREKGALEREKGVLVQENLELKEKLDGTLPYAKADGTPITLSNNFGVVRNPTWVELRAFLVGDDTASIPYDYGSFVCGDFAERLHNNAEKTGIRAGVAIIHFEGSVISHALNVFHTVDYGLVFVDSTGTLPFLVYDYTVSGRDVYTVQKGEDKVAYISIGKEYGLVPVSVAHCFSYDCYTAYKTKWWDYDQNVQAYNVDVDAYSLALGGRASLDEPEYSYFANWYSRLEQERLILERRCSELGDWYEPLGTVRCVEIYWSAERWAGVTWFGESGCW